MCEKLFSQLFLRFFVVMSLLRYFEPINRLPTPEEVGLSASTTQALEKALSVNLRADAEAKIMWWVWPIRSTCKSHSLKSQSTSRNTIVLLRN